ncbi:hypothetical protein [Variovorax boronicumulans]|uniref:hypothetical protein n=1 Tax=Variovorax boronicumulans TaxID=436515 RepID=UPI001C5912EF
MQFVVSKVEGDQWFWELRSRLDDELFARSAQGFGDHAAAVASVLAVQAAAGVAPAYDEAGRLMPAAT